MNKNISVGDLAQWCARNCAAFSISRNGVMAVALAGAMSAMTPVPSVATLGEIMTDEDGGDRQHGVRLAPRENAIYLQADGYESLALVLQRAFIQAAHGKGKERHANALPFDQQPMQTIASQVGVGFLLGQAIKKTQESQTLAPAHAVAELLGAINYLAGAVIALERVPTAANDNVPEGVVQNG
jgi:hypothetical protein